MRFFLITEGISMIFMIVITFQMYCFALDLCKWYNDHMEE